MYSFGERSSENLRSLDPKLQALCNEVIKVMDFSIIEGHRSVQRQEALYKEGKSQLDGITRMGKHNYYPSRAVDVLPYEQGHNSFDSSDKSELMFWRLLWEFKRASKRLNIPIELGAFWSFKDMPHIELV